MKICRATVITCLILFCSYSLTAQGRASKEDFLKGKENNTEVFVVTSDSIKHTGTKLSFPPDYFKTAEYIAIDNVRYPRKKKYDIIAYQTEDMYCAYATCIGDDVMRIRKGKLNLYINYQRDPVRDDVATRYIIEIQKNKFEYCYYGKLEKAFSDNPAVLNKFHELFPNEKKADKIFLRFNTPFKVEKTTLESMLLLFDMYNGN